MTATPTPKAGGLINGPYDVMSPAAKKEFMENVEKGRKNADRALALFVRTSFVSALCPVVLCPYCRL